MAAGRNSCFKKGGFICDLPVLVTVRWIAKHCTKHIHLLVIHLWLKRCCGSLPLGMLMSAVSAPGAGFSKAPSWIYWPNKIKSWLKESLSMWISVEFVQNEESWFPPNSGDFEIILIQKSLFEKSREGSEETWGSVSQLCFCLPVAQLSHFILWVVNRGTAKVRVCKHLGFDRSES